MPSFADIDLLPGRSSARAPDDLAAFEAIYRSFAPV